MPIAVLHRDDLLPVLPVLDGLEIVEERNAARMAALQSRDVSTIEERLAQAHRAYVARFNGVAAAWGWVATQTASIGELDLSFSVPEGERYLWNFVTAEAFRGRGIYPRLLQEIIRREAREAERFWIVYAPENRASERGIVSAGFQLAADLSFDANGAVMMRPRSAEYESMTFTKAEATSGSLTPCWRCARAGREWLMRCEPGACQCDYQRPLIACHEGSALMTR